MDAPSFHDFPWKQHAVMLAFSINLNLHVIISNYLVESDNFEHFWSVLTPFIWEKIDFDIFNFLDESEDSEHFSKNFELFLKKSIFENFYKCFNPFCMGKKYWISDFQFFGWIIKIYWKFLQVSFSSHCEENDSIFLTL